MSWSTSAASRPGLARRQPRAARPGRPGACAADYIHAARTGLLPDAQRAAVLLEREPERFENLLEDLPGDQPLRRRRDQPEPAEVDLAGLLDEAVDAPDLIAHGRKVDVSSRSTAVRACRWSRPTRAGLTASSPTWSRTPSSTPSKAGSGSGSAGAPATWSSPSPTRASIPSRTCPTSSSGFYRADVHRARTSAAPPGLAIASRTSTRTGSIDVQSEVGEGSTFTVTLPAIDPKPEPSDGQAAEPEPEPSRRLVPAQGRRLRVAAPSAASSARSPRWSPCSGRAARPAGVPETGSVVSVSSVTTSVPPRTPPTSGTSPARPPG